MRVHGRCGHLARLKTAGAAAVVLALGAPPAPASAEGLFSWLFGGGQQQRFQPSPSATMRSMRYRAAHRPSMHNAQPSPDVDSSSLAAANVSSASTKSSSTPTKSGGADNSRPLFVVVSLNDEHIRVYDDHGLVTSSIVSTGVEGHPTPKGVFTILGRERFHASNLYSGAPMPYMQRVTWSGVAMHVGVVTGHPASHGCIRLPAAFAVKLWGMTKIGERVVITRSDVEPEGFSSPLLPVAKLYPRQQETAPSAAPAVAAKTPAPVTAEAKPGATEPTLETASAASDAAKPAIASAAVDAAKPAANAAASDAAKPAATAQAPVVQAAAEPRPLNPKEWAARMKAKAVADQVAAVKAAKQASAELAAQGAETARLAGALRTAEAGLTVARARADAAARAFETADAALAARQRDTTVAMDEPTKSEADPLSKAKTAVLAKALEGAVAAKDAATQAKTKAEGDLETASLTADQARSAYEAQAALHDEITGRLRAATEAQTAAKQAEKEAIQRLAPISVLISKRDHKIYVRQGLAPLFDAPATIRDPERPLGTHVFIATGVEKDGTALHWTVLNVPDAGGSDPQESRRRRRWGQPEEPVSHLSPSSPAEALERVEVAQDVRDRIAERLWAGGSIIVSDRPVSNETSAVGTDLTVKIR
jgi:lipoprotein-anchoring transpeptidase ErfK/SrfK